MRIALISTPFVPVPPPKYGGTELMVYHLASELIARGHEVVLYATGDSRMPRVELRSLYPEAVWPPETFHELSHAAFAIHDASRSDSIDIIHTHIAPALAFASFVDVPIVYTLHHVREEPLQRFYAKSESRVRFVAISERQRELFRPEVEADVVHHGLNPGVYRLGPGGEYAAFLGRFAPEKGVHMALDAADRAGVPIRLAGQPHWKDRKYFDALVAPRLDRPGAVWDGEAAHGPKCALLGGACATLFPIDWEEPFGLVMIESMLCGTPVLAFARGSAPEIIDEGVTGWICRDVDDMARRLRRLARERLGFDRRACRARAAARFSVARMTARYLEVYAAAIDHPLLAAMPAETACPAS